MSELESAARPGPVVEVSPGSAEAFHEELRHVARSLPERISADPVTNAPNSSEGGSCRLTKEKLSFPAGSAVVPLDQPAAKVAIHWLEPEGPDSAVTWGSEDSIRSSESV